MIEPNIRRPWRTLDLDEFRSVLHTSPICQPDVRPDDIDDFAGMYDLELTTILDQLVPFHQITRRPPASTAICAGSFRHGCVDGRHL